MSDAPISFHGLTRWFGRRPALGAACAAIAWRLARPRCATPAGAALWAGAAFLLGPLGLLWMRCAVRWSAVVLLPDGSRRAVHLERAATGGVPWPLPEGRPTDLLLA